MSFQWLQLRITEEKERRERERKTLDRMAGAIEELRHTLTTCADAYNQAFGGTSVSLQLENDVIHVNVGETKIEVAADPSIPGFRIERGSDRLLIQIGLLPGDRLFYKDEEKYLTAEELTKRILDKVLFPKLKD